MNKKNTITDKNGRPRVRRSFVVYTDTAEKFSQVAKMSGVSASELLQQAMAQTVAAWEREHGQLQPIGIVSPTIDLTAAVQAAKATPSLKRGNPHPTGRKRKATKQ